MTDYNFVNLRNTNNNENRNLLFAIAISMLLLTFWNIFTSPSEEEIKKQQEQIKIEKELKEKSTQNDVKIAQQQTVKREKKEVFLKNKKIHIGFDVVNNRITFLALKDYKQHEQSIKNVVLLDDEHFIENGWIGTYKNNDINWKLDKQGDN